MQKLDRWLCVLLVGLAAAVGCEDTVHRDRVDDASTKHLASDASVAVHPVDAAQLPGICDLARCPAPSAGVACCTPDAVCGSDLLGAGLSCVANPGARKGPICKVSECPLPDVGDACCLPNGQCGRDPFGTSQVCYANPPRVNTDAGTPACTVKKCPTPDYGIACCTNNGKCGADATGTGFFCLQSNTPVDAAVPLTPSGAPNDPSVNGECPSYVGYGGAPVWGCCSRYGVCGTFFQGSCLLAYGALLPINPNEDPDGGLPAGRCHPPKAK